ncbi:hypothetical protein TIFTF001_001585 [Ficus carica]|uniref:DUF8039 domain-containing protein n=1 Tax=Ficus carica TaxID=3494 RepID=A0AA88D514_FICCA|nr:hypothetical protein TIFTF001_001585 [Ficus carica]
MTEENAALTVDQHNSFKASCTHNEKEPGVSDQQPTRTQAYMDYVPTDTIHEISLGEENMRVTITVPKLKRALLPIPTNEATILEEAVSGFVAWLKRLIIIETSLSQASRGPSHVPELKVEGNKHMKKKAGEKKLQSQPDAQQQSAQ